MSTSRQESALGHEHTVIDHYDRLTENFYLAGWHRDHIHWGLFEDGECPRGNEFLRDSPIVARAVERMIDVIVEPAHFETDHHVVDAGCGVGGTAVRLAEIYGCSVTGVNLNESQLEKAREKAIKANLGDQLDFEYADCSENLPFADDSIDVVVNIESACHYSDRGQFLREVSRILKPGGKIVAMDWMARDGITADEYEKYIQPMCEPWALVSLDQPSTYTQRLREAGLEVVEFEGFHGQELGNLQIIENNYRLLELISCGIQAPAFMKYMHRVWVLYEAWRTGHFDIQRYCAVKS